MYFTCKNIMLKLSQNLLPDSTIVQVSAIMEFVLHLKLLRSIIYSRIYSA